MATRVGPIPSDLLGHYAALIIDIMGLAFGHKLSAFCSDRSADLLEFSAPVP